jgi:hypothetical protein
MQQAALPQETPPRAQAPVAWQSILHWEALGPQRTPPLQEPPPQLMSQTPSLQTTGPVQARVEQSTLQEAACPHSIWPAHEPLQVTEHAPLPQVIFPAQAPPSQLIVQSAPLEQSIGPRQLPMPLQVVVQSMPAGQVHPLEQSRVQTPPAQPLVQTLGHPP